jgi:L-cystine uptake protein TcyP (sodium:dicarboxylate symporter family)
MGWGGVAAIAALLGLAACDMSVWPALLLIPVGAIIGRAHGERNGPGNW